MTTNSKRTSHLFCLLIICIIFLSGAGVTDTYADSSIKRPMEGFYLGVQGEYAFLDMSGEYELVAPSKVQDKTQLDWDSNEAALGGFVGWGRYLQNNYYLGTEAGYSFYLDDIEAVKHRRGASGTPFLFEVKNNHKISLSGIVGKGLSENTLLYGRLGVTYTDIEVVANSLVGDEVFAGSVHDWLGGTAGVGLAYNIWGNLALRAEYNFTTYFVGPEYDNDKNDGEKTDYDFYDNRVTLGLVYSF